MNWWTWPLPETQPEASSLMSQWLDNLRSGVTDDHANDVEMMVTLELPKHRPELAWQAIVEAVELANPDQLGAIGASALENLLAWHSVEFLPRAESQALSSRRFGQALESVWQFEMPEESWSRLEKFRSENRERWKPSDGAA